MLKKYDKSTELAALSLKSSLADLSDFNVLFPSSSDPASSSNPASSSHPASSSDPASSSNPASSSDPLSSSTCPWTLSSFSSASLSNRDLFKSLTSDVTFTSALPPVAPVALSSEVFSPTTYIGQPYGSVDHVLNHVVREYGQAQGTAEGSDGRSPQDTWASKLGIWGRGWSVLVPGCGLGGAAYWLSSLVDSIVLCDVAVNMVLAGRHIMRQGIKEGTRVYTDVMGEGRERG
ncbi:hypothetical protein TrRE_jg2428, partial [Triparma retinervis]